MTLRTASCSCGALSVTTTQDPIRVAVCHCLACQRRTGSVFGVQARFATEAVSIRGTSTQYVRTGDSGNQATFHFCPACGSTVYWTLKDRNDFVGVAVGAFADPSFPGPALSVYESRQHAWLDMPEDIEHLP